MKTFRYGEDQLTASIALGLARKEIQGVLSPSTIQKVQQSADAVAELDALYREKQMAVLVDVGEVAKRLQETSQGTMRFRAGGYFYCEDET